jgi:chemotaxis signal transduction protein
VAQDSLYTIVSIDRQTFAIAASQVREMLIMPAAAQLPNVPEYLRGVINLRGSVIPVLDVRMRIGRRSAREHTEEFCSLMEQREQDHVKWLSELEASVREGREFKLTLDPHACAFGKWYDTYRSDDPLIAGFLKKFDSPHQCIHAVGATVRAHMQREERDAALALIGQHHDTTLTQVRQLFRDLRDLIRQQQREIAMVLTPPGRTFAAAVDAVLSVERIPSDKLEPLPPGTSLECHGLVSGTGRRPKTDELVLILEPERLMESEMAALS